MPENYACGECGQRVPNGPHYHPYLYCELFKLGHHDQAEYLASYGFRRPAGFGSPDDQAKRPLAKVHPSTRKANSGREPFRESDAPSH